MFGTRKRKDIEAIPSRTSKAHLKCQVLSTDTESPGKEAVSEGAGFGKQRGKRVQDWVCCQQTFKGNDLGFAGNKGQSALAGGKLHSRTLPCG